MDGRNAVAHAAAFDHTVARRSLRTGIWGRSKLRLLKQQWLHFTRDESGQSLIEYALIVALIALGAITTMGTVATALSTGFSKIASHLNSSIT